MLKVVLGKTGIEAHKNGFGALPVQRIGMEDAVSLLRRAREGGMNFFDTARFYTDSEEKLGEAFAGVRDQIYLATKTMAQTAEEFWKDLELSLKNLQTEYVDLYQFHNPPFCPKPGDGSGLYETLQFPFCYLATEHELKLVEKCKKAEMGFIAMKGLSGGLLTNSAAAYAFLAQFDHVLPIWGIQKEKELDEFLSYIENPPGMTEEIKEQIARDKEELGLDFCRACGYCMPCPVGIEINTCARMSQLIRRSPSELQLTPEVQAKMKKVEECRHCGACKKKCPFGLDTPALLEKNYADYKEILAGRVKL